MIKNLVLNSFEFMALSQVLKNKVKVIKTVDDMKELLKHAKLESEYKIGMKVKVDNKMQTGYEYELTEKIGKNFDKDFNPHLTPKEMLELGVFEGKYCKVYFYKRSIYFILFKNSAISFNEFT